MMGCTHPTLALKTNNRAGFNALFILEQLLELMIVFDQIMV